MRTEAALRAFGLTEQSTISDLNKAYQLLIRRYHPDRHPERQIWARTMIAKINAAYDHLLDHLAARVYEEISEELGKVIEQHDRFSEVLNQLLSIAIDGIYVFYQYGLENVHLRDQGTWRLRYRGAVRRVETAVQHLSRLEAPNDLDAETLAACTGFASAFKQSMRISQTQSPAPSRYETEAYRLYRSGTEQLDELIKRALFAGELDLKMRPAAPHASVVIHEAFMGIIARYSESSWVSQAVVKLCLLEALLKLLEYAERLPVLGGGDDPR